MHLFLIYKQPLVRPLHHKKGVEGDAEVLVINLGDVLDIDPHVHHGLRLVGQIKLGVILRDADRISLE